MAEDRERTLLLFRHAKSAWPDVADHERPLAKRGKRDAPVMGRWLRDAGLVPDRVLCSTARRARQTWQLATDGLGSAPPVTLADGVYLASVPDLLGLIRQVPPAVTTLCVVGHDPSISETALLLAGDQGPAPETERIRAKFPTAAIAVLAVTGSWRGLGPGKARLATFVTPADLG